MSPWWKWDWDRAQVFGVLTYGPTLTTRWRRGWVTLYKFVTRHGTEWRLYLPFNINVGFHS